MAKFGEALDALQEGKKLTREGWNGKGQFIKLQVPDENSKMGLPYIYIKTVDIEVASGTQQGKLVPWLASQTDMLAIDWIEVTE